MIDNMMQSQIVGDKWVKPNSAGQPGGTARQRFFGHSFRVTAGHFTPAPACAGMRILPGE
jgi:hypothetical protein